MISYCQEATLRQVSRISKAELNQAPFEYCLIKGQYTICCMGAQGIRVIMNIVEELVEVF